jgi:DNA-binding IclR family transcriptional regulator
MANVGNKGLKKGLEVFRTLLSGEIMMWRTLDEVAEAAGLSRNEAYAALIILAEYGWAEKGAKGFRAAASGLAAITAAMNECLRGYADRWGLK